MVQFNYRAKNEDGEFQTYSCETLFKSVSDFFKKNAANAEFCNWLEEEHVVCYFVKTDGERATRKCPLK